MTPRQVLAEFSIVELGQFIESPAMAAHKGRSEDLAKMFKAHMDGVNAVIKSIGNMAKTIARTR